MPLDEEPEIPFFEVHEIVVPHLGHVPIAKGDFTALPKKVQQFIAYYVSLTVTCTRVCVRVCIGGDGVFWWCVPCIGDDGVCR